MIETDRLFLRPMAAEDVDPLLGIFGDPKVMAAFGAEPFDREQMKAWLRRNLDHQTVHGYGLFSVVLKESGELIGDCGLEIMELDDLPESSTTIPVAAARTTVGATPVMNAPLDRRNRPDTISRTKPHECIKIMGESRPMVVRQALIDSDIHNGIDRNRVLEFLPEPWKSRYRSGGGGPGTLGYWNPNGVLRSDALTPTGTRIDADPHDLATMFLDPFGIEFCVLNPQSSLQLGLSPEPDFAAAMVSAINDVTIEDWLPTDPRYRGSVVISPADPVQAAGEIRRVGAHPGIVQVLMGSGARFPYGQRYYDPIYEAASEFALPVAIHPGSEGVGVSGPPTAVGYPSSYLEWHTNLVGSYIAHLISLLTEGTFVKYPKLRFVLIEGGFAWIPPILWRLDKNWKGLRQTVPWVERLPSEYAYDHFLLTTQPMEEPDRPEHLKAILEMFPAEKMLMFSSDFPHWDGDTPDFAARSLPKELRPRVMSETARELYRLPPSHVAAAAADD